MMLRPRRRRAATIVEAAMVLSITFLLLFGVFEYCRFVFLVQVAENAVREGARYAIARTGDGTTLSDIQNYVKSQMAGRDKDLSNFSVEVLNVDPATGEAIPNSTWDQTPFGGAIRVRITGTYYPIVPTLIKRQASIAFQASTIMTSEAN